jgi:hypothetical protein
LSDTRRNSGDGLPPGRFCRFQRRGGAPSPTASETNANIARQEIFVRVLPDISAKLVNWNPQKVAIEKVEVA